MSPFSRTAKVFKEHPVKIVLASLFILSFMGLKLWNNFTPISTHDWNKKEVSRINVADPSNFAFAVMGDNKGNRTIFQPLLRNVGNDKEIAFALDIGDLVRKGTNGNYRSFLKQVQRRLSIPFLTAIGNHDLDNGSGNYQAILGPTHYAFQIGKNYFIVLEAIKESGIDPSEHQWVEDELHKAQASETRLVFMHVPPFDPRESGGRRDRDWKDLLDLFRRYGVTHLFTSHIHGHFSGVREEIPYTITGGAGGRLQGSDPQHFFHHYIKVHLHDGKIDTTVQRIEAKNVVASVSDLIQDDLLGWGLLVGAGISLLVLGFSIKRSHGSKLNL